MIELTQCIRKAWRRLILQRLVATLPWCLLGTLSLAALAVAWPKFVVLDVDPFVWTAAWLAGAVAAALLLSALILWYRPVPLVQAAIEVDHRFGLQERLSSSMCLKESDRETEAGRALMDDAVRYARGIQIDERFRVRPARQCWLPLAPIVVVFGLAVFFPNKVIQQQAVASVEPVSRKQVEKSADILRRKLAERRRRAEEQGLKEAGKLFEKLEQGTRDLKNRRNLDRKEALVELSDLARQMERRKQALGGTDAMRKQLAGIKDLRRGPADKFGRAMREGKLDKAIEELNKVQRELAAGKLDQEAVGKLAEQLDQMKRQLQQGIDAHRRAEQDLQRRVAQARDQGDLQEASRLQDHLDRLSQKGAQIDQLESLAQALEQASSDAKKGSSAGAAAKLAQVSQKIGAMKDALDELEMLDDAMMELADAKDAMNCKECGGAGCRACGGDGNGEGAGMGKGQGDGLGQGAGRGARPEEEHKTGAYDTRVRQNVGAGKAVITDFVHGPNAKGTVREGIKEEMDAAERRATDPLSGQQLPKTQRAHAREYFDAFRDGE